VKNKKRFRTALLIVGKGQSIMQMLNDDSIEVSTLFTFSAVKKSKLFSMVAIDS
jgi:hypothetical protein